MSTMNPDPNPVHITHDLLVQFGACVEQREAFAAAFPDGLLLTPEPDEEVVAVILKEQLDVRWLCQRVLSSSAWAEYLRAIAPAWAEYTAVSSAAWAEYRHVSSTDHAEYERTRVAAWSEYQRTIAPAWAEYQRAIARAAWCALSDRGNWR